MTKTVSSLYFDKNMITPISFILCCRNLDLQKRKMEIFVEKTREKYAGNGDKRENYIDIFPF